MLFGSDKFTPYTGELTLAYIAKKEGQVDSSELKKFQRRREVQCAVNLAKWLQPVVEVEEQELLREAKRKLLLEEAKSEEAKPPPPPQPQKPPQQSPQQSPQPQDGGSSVGEQDGVKVVEGADTQGEKRDGEGDRETLLGEQEKQEGCFLCPSQAQEEFVLVGSQPTGVPGVPTSALVRVPLPVSIRVPRSERKLLCEDGSEHLYYLIETRYAKEGDAKEGGDGSGASFSEAGDTSGDVAGNDAVTVVMWRRFSEFATLHADVRAAVLAADPAAKLWQAFDMDTTFALPHKPLLGNAMASFMSRAGGEDFGENRKQSLEVMMQGLVQIMRGSDKVGAPASPILHTFLNQEDDADGDEALNSNGAGAAAAQVGFRRTSGRRSSAGQSAFYALALKREAALRTVEAAARKEAADLVEASFGDTMLETIGYIYTNSGEQYLGYEEGFLGMAGVAAGADSYAHSISTKASAFGSAISTMRAASKLHSEAQAKTKAEGGAKEGEPAVAVDPQAMMTGKDAEETQELALETMWAVSRIDIESTLKGVCAMATDDHSVSVGSRNARAKAMVKMGQVLRFPPRTLALFAFSHMRSCFCSCVVLPRCSSVHSAIHSLKHLLSHTTPPPLLYQIFKQVAAEFKAKAKAKEETENAEDGEGEEEKDGKADDDGTWGQPGEGIVPGVPVQIQGLEKGAQYNGSVGMVEAQDDERWVVLLPPAGGIMAGMAGGEVKRLKIKPANLRVMLQMPDGPGGMPGMPGKRKKGGKLSAREKLEAAMLGMAQKKNEMGE
jgi:hypothetical protein